MYLSLRSQTSMSVGMSRRADEEVIISSQPRRKLPACVLFKMSIAVQEDSTASGTTRQAHCY
jgi:hypothetical protein